MKYVFAIAVIFMLINLEEKCSKILKQLKNDKEANKKELNINLEECLEKKVVIHLNDECEIYNNSEYLYQGVEGEITNFDSRWLSFKFYNKTKKKNICQLIKIDDIESIDIISK